MPVSTSWSRNPSGKLSTMTPAGAAGPPLLGLVPLSSPGVGVSSHQNSKSFFTSFLGEQEKQEKRREIGDESWE